jgi:hypothetical protein
MSADHPTATRSKIHMFAAGEPHRGMYRYFPPATRAELWGGLAFIVLPLLGAVWVLTCRSEALALEHNSVNVEGTVARLWVTYDVKKRPHFHVAYEYVAPAGDDLPVFRNEVEFSERRFAELKRGEPIILKVCQTAPANHQVVGTPPRIFLSAGTSLFCLGILSLLALAGTIMLWWWWVSSGKMVPAQLFVRIDADVIHVVDKHG